MLFQCLFFNSVGRSSSFVFFVFSSLVHVQHAQSFCLSFVLAGERASSLVFFSLSLCTSLLYNSAFVCTHFHSSMSTSRSHFIESHDIFAAECFFLSRAQKYGKTSTLFEATWLFFFHFGAIDWNIHTQNWCIMLEMFYSSCVSILLRTQHTAYTIRANLIRCCGCYCCYFLCVFFFSLALLSIFYLLLLCCWCAHEFRKRESC